MGAPGERRRSDRPDLAPCRPMCQQVMEQAVSCHGSFLCSMSTRLRLRAGDGFEREVDDLGAVQLFASVDAGAELGVGQMVAQQCRGLAQEVGVGTVGEPAVTRGTGQATRARAANRATARQRPAPDDSPQQCTEFSGQRDRRGDQASCA